jgi:hypothetical protein
MRILRIISIALLLLSAAFSSVVSASPNDWTVPWLNTKTLLVTQSPLTAGHWTAGGSNENWAVDLAPTDSSEVRLYAPTDIEEILAVYSDNGWHDGYGNFIRFKTKCGCTVVFAHLKNVNKAIYKGQKNIPRGTALASVGDSGSAKGRTHLHLEFWNYKRAANISLFGINKSELIAYKKKITGGFQLASSGSSSIAKGTYYIQLAGSNLMLDIEWTNNVGNQHNGARIIAWPKDSSHDSQLWEIIPLGSNIYKLMSVRARGKSIEISNNDTRDGARVQTWDYLDSYNTKKWRISRNANSTYTFTNVNSGKVLDLNNNYRRAGNYFHAWSFNGTSAQQFNLIKVSSSTRSASLSSSDESVDEQTLMTDDSDLAEVLDIGNGIKSTDAFAAYDFSRSEDEDGTLGSIGLVEDGSGSNGGCSTGGPGLVGIALAFVGSLVKMKKSKR